MEWNPRRRFSLILLLIILGGFLLTSWLSYRVARDSLGEQIAQDALPLTSDNLYSEIQQDLIRPVFISSLMAQDTYVRDWALHGEQQQDAIVKYLKEIQSRYNAVTSFFVSERTHRYYHTSGVIKEVSRQDPADAWYFRTLALPTGEDFEINIDHDTANPQSLVVFVNYRVYDYAGNPIGITGVGLAVTKVQELVETYQARYHRRVYFVDKEGQVALQAQGDHRHSLFDVPGLGALATRILTQPSGSFRYEHNGHPVFVASRWVEPFKWYLMVEQEETPFDGRLWNSLLTNLLLSLAIAAGVLVVAHFTFRGYQQRLERMASTDKLTGAMNRQVFEEQLTVLHQLAVRRRHPLALAMLDLDYFKRVNDDFGHLVGDQVLKQFVQLCWLGIRKSDLLCRWGGEEFVLVLPDCPLAEAERLVEGLRSRLASQPFKPPVTLSAGLVVVQEGETVNQALQRADAALYRAKEAGRNRLEVEGARPTDEAVA
ncbi:sensor domain-containing diguanylate cyclase [Pseudaeromonas sp. ZJS20]|uniref:sensor domain-containing diguanylate cyclase n=1 Tax=Pseudaeromonas aegiceratis TaxID=3153928 RepID=UPI00390C457D